MPIKLKKDDGNKQRNFVIPIVPVEKRKLFLPATEFCKCEGTGKNKQKQIVITEFLKFYPKSILF